MNNPDRSLLELTPIEGNRQSCPTQPSAPTDSLVTQSPIPAPCEGSQPAATGFVGELPTCRPTLIQQTDQATITWLIEQSSTNQFYHLTIAYKDSSVLSKRSHYRNLYEVHVRKRIQKLAGWSQLIISDIYEYECNHSFRKIDGANCPHHIHAIIGIPANEHIRARFEKGITPALVTQTGYIKSIQCDRIATTAEDFARVYHYIRKENKSHLMGET